MASIRASEWELERAVRCGASDKTGWGVVVDSEAVKAPLGALVALRARGSSESAMSVESRTLSRRDAQKLQKFGQAH